jgi:2-hydroxy-3-keto-5-methylthiopentenyl-1-phosphate phosphatase
VVPIRPRDLDLARTAVFLDFDGTITTADVGVHLLEHATPNDDWRAVADQYRRGEIESRECLIEEWKSVDGSEAELRALAAEVAIDPGFVSLVQALRGAGAEVTVVSDGFGFYVDDVCAPLGLDVRTNAVNFATRALEFPHLDPSCPCSSCGVCKQAPIRDAHTEGLATVLVGDGASDRKAAVLADVVFAKDELAAWCERFGVPCQPFETLVDVHHSLFAS